VARDDTYEKQLTPTQASDARDALAKAIYGRIFDWIVSTINLSIQVEDPAHVRANIGVLDIFGFECFVHNSFEQLCINYTNETLQQQFNQYIFKMEQVEYQAEKIEWSFIEFPDNQDCLDLIENKVSGILAMIDDECRLPSSSVGLGLFVSSSCGGGEC
jgi:myosin-5